MKGDREDEDAPVVSIGALTREATFRRFEELARRSDRVPPEVVASAMAGHHDSTWRSVDDELAVLVYDSDEPLPAANVRSIGSSLRRLSFEAPDLAIEVEVALSRPRQIVCQIMPPQPAAVEVRTSDGLALSESDDLGTFHCAALPPGPLSLRCTPSAPGSAPVATSWFVI